ncbi:hypothetical protein PROVRUST_06582 [Providencia rustigianii DSM 4541]|uniref:Uncharacterized protein n=1 Tax=Providencia rustigianii DSM 4541 TaxID=500637 RepID=D1P2Z7_9GAMM|nr:hypothetical protein PROVRUST_06582 [Providencia rustigianii DSM 4541]
MLATTNIAMNKVVTNRCVFNHQDDISHIIRNVINISNSFLYI